MPRLRRARTPEEAAAIPADQPVVIRIDDNAPVEVETAPEVEKVEPKVETKPEPTVAPEPAEPDEDENPLQKQLEELQRGEEARKAREQELLAQVANEQRQRREREAELARERGGREQAEYDAVLNALGASQEAADRAQGDLETAMTNGDFKAAADAQRRLSLAMSRVDRLEEGKTSFETRREEAKKTPPAPAPQDFEGRIAGLPEAGRAWLRGKPEFITDPGKNEQIIAAHDYVTKIERKPAWTPEYFERLETHLGIRQPPAAHAPAAPAARTEQRSPPMSAPVSRDSPNLTTGRPQRREITLSAEQRDAARVAGVDDFTYAKGVVELERRKKLGMYPDR